MNIKILGWYHIRPFLMTESICWNPNLNFIKVKIVPNEYIKYVHGNRIRPLTSISCTSNIFTVSFLTPPHFFSRTQFTIWCPTSNKHPTKSPLKATVGSPYRRFHRITCSQSRIYISLNRIGVHQEHLLLNHVWFIGSMYLPHIYPTVSVSTSPPSLSFDPFPHYCHLFAITQIL